MVYSLSTFTGQLASLYYKSQNSHYANHGRADFTNMQET